MRDAVDGCAAVVPPRGHRLRRAVGRGPRGLRLRHPRGHGQRRPPGGGGRRRALRARLELRGVRRCGASCPSPRPRRRSRSAPTPAPSSRRRACAPTPPTPASSPPSACASSTCTGRGRTPARPTPASSAASCRRRPPATPVTIYGDGRQTRDFVYVGDVVGAILAALQRPLAGRLGAQRGHRRARPTCCEILEVVEERAGRALERRMEPRARGRHPSLARRRRPRPLGARLGGRDRSGRRPRRDVGVVHRRVARGRRSRRGTGVASRRARSWSAPCPSAAAPRWPCSR